jgi:hypothetical protein
MTNKEARLAALSVIVRVVVSALQARPQLLLRLQLTSLDAAYALDSVSVMREICKALEKCE